MRVSLCSDRKAPGGNPTSASASEFLAFSPRQLGTNPTIWVVHFESALYGPCIVFSRNYGIDFAILEPVTAKMRRMTTKQEPIPESSRKGEKDLHGYPSKYCNHEERHEAHEFKSNEVLDILRPKLRKLGFKVEDKSRGRRISVPVFFGERGKWQKSFQVDAYHETGKTVIEIEAGVAFTNFQFLKDVFLRPV